MSVQPPAAGHDANEAEAMKQADKLRDDPRVLFYDQAYKQQNTVWDLGQPQPALAKILSERETNTKDTVLEIGCGTGEHVLGMGKRGFHGMGVDSSEKAVEEGTNKAKERGLADRVTFKALDCRQLPTLNQHFDIVIDSGFSHILPIHQRQSNADTVRSIMKPGGRLYILSYAGKAVITAEMIRTKTMPSDWFLITGTEPQAQRVVTESIAVHTIPEMSTSTPPPIQFEIPPGMTKPELQRLYSKEKGWRVDMSEPSTFNLSTGNATPALLSIITYVGDPSTQQTSSSSTPSTQQTSSSSTPSQ